jgi:hypothetical protein
MLAPAPLALEKTVIRAPSASILTEFEQRRARRIGQFMTESEIRKLDFVETSDLLRTFQAVAVASAGVLNTRGFGGRQCPLSAVHRRRTDCAAQSECGPAATEPTRRN